MLIIDGDYPMAIGAMDLNRDLHSLLPPELRGAAPDRFAEESRPDADTMASLPEMRRAGIAAALVKVVARHYRSGSPMWGYRGPEVTYAAARHNWPTTGCWRRAGRPGSEGRLRTLQPPAIVVDRGVTGRTAGGIHPRHGGGRPHSGNHPGAPVVAGRNTSHQPFPLRPQHLLPRHRDRDLGGPVPARQGPVAGNGIGRNDSGCHPRFRRLGQGALDLFGGPVLASHQNCRAIVPGERQFPDDQLRAVIRRGGVIGVSMDSWMLYRPGLNWGGPIPPRRSVYSKEAVTLEDYCDHVDHICQLAGNSRHAAIGGDTDGQGGSGGAPAEIDTVADYQKVARVLEQRGYSSKAIEDVMYRNWQRFFETHLPQSPDPDPGSSAPGG